MKIVNIIPGFGGTFYCGNCMRDSAFSASLREAGYDAITIPMYLPLTMSAGETMDEIPVFYGAVGIYMRQFSILRNMPGWLEHLFNSKPMLKFAAKKAGSTRANGMEALTESMLLGSEGHQVHELNELVRFLKDHVKPDVVHLSNALLMGLAGKIRDEVGVPVVTTLQDEDVWVDAMEEGYQEKIWNLMAVKARDVDAFVAVSNFFAGKMTGRMQLPPEKVHVVNIGVNPEHYREGLPATTPQAIGYLSRICPDNGFGILADAFILLKQDRRFATLKLRATGGMTNDDKPFLTGQMEKFEKAGVLQDVEILHPYGNVVLNNFFRTISLLSVPVLKGEAFGLYQIEALAAGIPLVQPELGAFPEIISATGGGATYKPNTPEALAAKLGELLAQPKVLETMSQTGRRSVVDKFDHKKMTGKMVKIYQSVIN
jgi:glycosyltransferase involved in cell wall biosynthesis